MAQRRKVSDPLQLQQDLTQLVQELSDLSSTEELRLKIIHLVKIFNKLRELGISIVSINPRNTQSARDRLLYYFLANVGQLIEGDELLVVSGIQEYARRIRELRVELGWHILSGEDIKEMIKNEEIPNDFKHQISTDSYLLLSDKQDIERAERWKLANNIRKQKNTGIRDKILQFLRANAGRQVKGDELRYVAENKTEWARRVRELRTEFGWPIYTRNSGRIDLPIGTYILEEDRQGAVHDRKISDMIRVQVLERDHHSCRKCGWNRMKIHPGDPRKFLELHHIRAHADKGANTLENLITLCNVCHDDIHRVDKNNTLERQEVFNWLNQTS